MVVYERTFLAGKGLGRVLFANGPLRVGSPPPLRIEK